MPGNESEIGFYTAIRIFAIWILYAKVIGNYATLSRILRLGKMIQDINKLYIICMKIDKIFLTYYAKSCTVHKISGSVK